MSLKILQGEMDFTKTKSKAAKFKLKKIKSAFHDETYTNEGRKVSTLMCLNILGHDDLYFCEDCSLVRLHECPKHPLFPVKDAKVSPRCKRGIHSGYCWETLPPGLAIRKSKIPHAGLGVFATQFFPARTRFGPYAGRKQTNEEVAYSFGYSWNIMKDGKISHFVDGRDPKDSNWMRFVNCARYEHEQNVTAFQYQGEIYYRSHRDIYPGAEILVFYGEHYAKDLGIKLEFVDKSDRNSSPKTEQIDQPLLGFNCGIGLTPPNVDVCQSRQNEGRRITTSRITLGDELKKCDVCGKAFKSSGNLRQHKKIHLGLKPFMCDLCNKTFARKSQLKGHIVMHSGVKAYQCGICAITFTRKDHLQRHQRIHSGLKPFLCDICGKAFNRLSDMREHKVVHSKLRSFVCACGETFKRRHDLLKHRRKQSDPSSVCKNKI